jgi:tripartite-type tricarboxylate transporter receptor subunit TctC
MNKKLSTLTTRCGGLLLGLAGLLMAPLAQAQTPNYPAKPVQWVVGFPPGGAADILARLVAVKVSELWGQQVVIENRAGTGSTIAAELVARAPADGYTMLFVSSSHAAAAGLYPKLTYDSVNSFSAITVVASAPQVLLATPNLPAKNLPELLQLAKSRPGGLTYGSAGNGSTTHLAGELMWDNSGVQLSHIPYKGGAQALTDTISGQINLLFLSLPAALPQIRSGKVRPLAVTSTKRSPSLPEVGAASETVPGYEATNWYALLGPANMPRPLITKMASNIATVLKDPQLIKRFSDEGAEIVGNSPEDAQRFLQSEVTKWTRVIKTVGVVAE